jgi:hypothetical protein
MSWLVDAFHWFFGSLWTSILTILSALEWILAQLLSILLQGAFDVVLGVLQGLDVGNLAVNAAASWGALNPNVAWFLNQSGVSTGMTMLGTAYLIRFTINLIPAEFTRV